MDDVPFKPSQPLEPYPDHPPQPAPQQDESRQYRDLSQYSLSVEAAAKLFVHAGVPRSPRSIIRFCSNGALDCTKIETERNLKYLVTLESVNIRIAELQQIKDFSHDAPYLDTSRHIEIQHDTSRHDAPPDESKKIEDLTSRVGELERANEKLVDEKRDLEITNRVKDALLKNAQQQVERVESRLIRISRVVGDLATRLHLKAPEEDTYTSEIIAYLDAPSQAANPEHENLVDASS